MNESYKTRMYDVANQRAERYYNLLAEACIWIDSVLIGCDEYIGDGLKKRVEINEPDLKENLKQCLKKARSEVLKKNLYCVGMPDVQDLENEWCSANSKNKVILVIFEPKGCPLLEDYAHLEKCEFIAFEFDTVESAQSFGNKTERTCQVWEKGRFVSENHYE